MTAATSPAISVVVCTYDRPNKLAVCLQALSAQTVAACAEVIVVDDGSRSETGEVARRFDVRYLRHDTNLGLARARNTGIRSARAPLVAFTDDDCVPAPDWLERLLEQYAEPDVVAVGGGVVALSRATLMHRYLADTNRLAPLEAELGVSNSIAYRARLYMLRNLTSDIPRPGVRSVYSLVGANMSFRRDALHAVGLFDDRITFGGEDEDICRRLRIAYPDSRLVFTARAVIAHDYDGELGDTLRRSFKYGAGSARSYLKNADQNPTLFPIPLCVAALLALGLRWRWIVPLALAAPLAAFPRWPIEAARRRRPELLAFPWIQAFEEAAHDAGFARSWWRLRHHYPATSTLDPSTRPVWRPADADPVGPEPVTVP